MSTLRASRHYSRHSLSACDNVDFPTTLGDNMKFFLVWECFDDSFRMIEKGYHFLFVNDGEDIDIKVGEYADAMATARNMRPFHFVITTCQPMPESN